MKYSMLMNLRLFDGEGGAGGAVGSEGAGGNGGQTKAGYTFEQAEEIANNRAEKASRAALADFYRKQGLSEEEITTAIADFKAKQAANKPNVSAIEKERDDALKELEQMKNTNLLKEKGVRSEDMDYVMFKIGKMVDDKTDFKKAAEKFLKENPRYAGSSNYRVSTSTQHGTKGEGTGVNGTINDAIRNRARR